MSIIYGEYTFPDPQPIWSESNEGIYYSGLLDHLKSNVSLVGALTGNNINDIYIQKTRMISGLSSGFAGLTLDYTGYPYANAKSIDFGNSSQSRYLPYSITFEAFENKSFSQFYGVTEPVNSWDFKEEDGRKISASHNVSAKGIKVDSSSPLDNAKNFVNSQIDFYKSGISLFWPGRSGILVSRNESVNRLNNTYGIVSDYKLTTSNEPINSSGILTLNTQITFDSENGINARVNGDILGGLTGAGHPLVTTGMFSPNDAYNTAVNAIARSKSTYESGLYLNIVKQPSSFNYDINESANTINFSFEFLDSEKQKSGDVLNTYNVTISSDKDNGLITAKIEGEFKYQNVFDFFDTTGYPELGVRWKKVNSGFNAFDPYPVVYDYYKNFVDLNIYDQSGVYFLLKDETSSEISKKPFDNTISYQYSYDNRIDITSGELRNASFSISYDQPIAKTGIVESLLGFASQETHKRTMGFKSVSASCDNNSGENNVNVNLLKKYASGLIQPIYEIEQNNYSASPSSISVNIRGIY